MGGREECAQVGPLVPLLVPVRFPSPVRAGYPLLGEARSVVLNAFVRPSGSGDVLFFILASAS